MKLQELEIELLQSPEEIDFKTQIFADKFTTVFSDLTKKEEIQCERDW